MLDEICKKRNLMKIWPKGDNWVTRRKEIIDILLEEEYGFIPKRHDKIDWEIVEENIEYCAGKVTLRKINATVYFNENNFTFPIYSTIPNSSKKLPFFVFLNFDSIIPHKYFPAEEICDRGYAVLSIGYREVAEDEIFQPDPRYRDEIKKIFYADDKRKCNDAGKLAIWAWAASRVMDYAETLDCLDFSCANVIGHSRLGKTALLAGALDERFTCAISNDSGTSGAAITKMKTGENIRDIAGRRPYWYCENYLKYIDNEDSLPFDQHFLVAAMAPRKVYIASAEEDSWSDPDSEFLSAYAANEVYEKLGIRGLVAPDRFPVAGDVFHDGNIGYHLRKGKHYFSREDWNIIMDYLDSKRK